MGTAAILRPILCHYVAQSEYEVVIIIGIDFVDGVYLRIYFLKLCTH